MPQGSLSGRLTGRQRREGSHACPFLIQTLPVAPGEGAVLGKCREPTRTLRSAGKRTCPRESFSTMWGSRAPGRCGGGTAQKLARVAAPRPLGKDAAAELRVWGGIPGAEGGAREP